MADDSDARHPATVKVPGTTRAARGYAIRDFFPRGDVPFEWFELKCDEQARAIIGRRLLPGPTLSSFTKLLALVPRAEFLQIESEKRS